MEPLRHDGSLIASLHELRAIEEQRLVEERLVLRRAEEAEREARETARQRERDAEEARGKAERDAAIALEVARADAEREARIRADVAVQAEQARLQAALDQQRLASEHELRRAAIARTRPTWMLVTTALAVVASAGLVVFAIDRQHDAATADAARAVAERQHEAARDEARQVKGQLEAIDRDLAVIDGRVQQAITDLAAADTAAKRTAEGARLAELRKQDADARARAQKAHDDAVAAERKKPIVVSDDCKNNAVCK